ncbi:18175_t:CDS:2, partial [Gigaspora margarita]
LKTNQQKFETLGQWLDNEAFNIFAVMKTNLNGKKGIFVGKKEKRYKRRKECKDENTEKAENDWNRIFDINKEVVTCWILNEQQNEW